MAAQMPWLPWNVIVPRQSVETSSPVFPIVLYSIESSPQQASNAVVAYPEQSLAHHYETSQIRWSWAKLGYYFFQYIQYNCDAGRFRTETGQGLLIDNKYRRFSALIHYRFVNP